MRPGWIMCVETLRSVITQRVVCRHKTRSEKKGEKSERKRGYAGAILEPRFLDSLLVIMYAKKKQK